MDLDVIYRNIDSPKWDDNPDGQYVKQICRPESTDMAICNIKESIDLFVIKKILRNLISRLKPNGIICIECKLFNVSLIMDFVKRDLQQLFFPIVFINKDDYRVYVIIYKSSLNKPKCDNIIRISNWEDIGHYLIRFTNYSDIILFLGDDTLPFACIAKKLSRYVIAIGNDKFWVDKIKNQGVREVAL
jgi:hypothetical protein